jgi:uncharacterized cupredoxin-like copper-binding protein
MADGAAFKWLVKLLGEDRIMTRSMTYGMFAAVALAATIAMHAEADAAGSIVKVSVTEASADFDPALKLGMGMAGDMAKATMFMTAVPDTVPAGEVTFELKNESKTVVHEMLVAPMSDPAKPLVFNENENRVDEEKSGDLGEVAELEPGKSGALRVTLKPGTYLLYCNIPGHYMAGMWTKVTAK